jgi:hypothetical protein
MGPLEFRIVERALAEYKCRDTDSPGSKFPWRGCGVGSTK